tara:strand:- start:1287 stop:1676 length:390 start_codon:yes stop_codon:yes gene_type:complete
MTTEYHGEKFAGQTYDERRDGDYLSSLYDRVVEFMGDGRYHTLQEIQHACGGTEASVSARLRDMRKDEFGAHKVEARCFPGRVWMYRKAPTGVQTVLFDANNSPPGSPGLARSQPRRGQPPAYCGGPDP